MKNQPQSKANKNTNLSQVVNCNNKDTSPKKWDKDFAQKQSVKQTLDFFFENYANVLVVLPSAFKSAKSCKLVKNRAKVYELFYKLVTELYKAYSSGYGDMEAKGIFGNSYASNEGDAGNNRNAKKYRTFEYDGEDVLMLRHLKIGNKYSDYETFRMYFHWDNKNKKIVIGHCGDHLGHK